jgi:hypothetical protein
MMVRLVATDLDGAVLRADGSVSARTWRTLQQALVTELIVVLVADVAAPYGAARRACRRTSRHDIP